MNRTLRSKLAPIYQPIMPAFFDRPAIEENRATCDDCAMCDTTAPAGVETTHFDSETKCCTYHPTLPNYLVGAVFADPSAELEEGRQRLRKKIAQRIGVTPRWLSAPRKFLVHLEASRYWSFGRAKSMTCPYYQGGRCSIWHHRETVCSTFFCKYDGAAYGWAFWDALKQYMFRVESALTAHAIEQVGPNTNEPKIARMKMTLEDLEDRPPPELEYAGFWADWQGREEAFYVACYEAVRSLDAASVAEMMARTTQAPELYAAMESKYDALTKPKLAERLVKNRRLNVVPAEGGVVVTSYSRYDPFFMSDALRGVVDAFRDGETVAEGLARIKAEQGFDVPEDLLLRLQMLEVVVPPEEAPPPKPSP